ncbi:MAG: RNA polymerase sigma factor [Ruminococcus sp.]|nr:RNA polymerase sigma factor [Ruminococcus sp.]
MNPEELKDKLTRYKDMVYRIAYTYLHSTADAEDISQETFLKLYLRKEPFPDAESEKAWLIRVTLNACCNLKKSFWQRMRSDMPEQMPGTIAESVEESKLYHAVFALPEKYRVVILLYYYEEYSVREIAAITGRNESTVQTQLERGRKRLRKQLEQQGGFYYGKRHISEHDGTHKNVQLL